MLLLLLQVFSDLVRFRQRAKAGQKEHMFHFLLCLFSVSIVFSVEACEAHCNICFSGNHYITYLLKNPREKEQLVSLLASAAHVTPESLN